MKYRIIHEDKDIIVVYKEAGLALASARIGQEDLVSLLTKYIARQGAGARSVGANACVKPAHSVGANACSKASSEGSGACVKPTSNRVPYLGVVHRLDQPVSGLVVFAKNKDAAAFLSKQAAGTDMEKIYEATVYGHLPEKEGVLENYLIKDGKTNMSLVYDEEVPESKYSKLAYEVISSDEKTDTVRIKLYTGRHHQIRAQFAHAGYPLLGDVKYAREEVCKYSKTLGIRFVKLEAVELSFVHPSTKERVRFASK